MKTEDYINKQSARWRALVQIQKGHLERWKKLLKPEVYDKLEKRIESLTPSLSAFINVQDEPDVPRGVTIEEELFNYVERKLTE